MSSLEQEWLLLQNQYDSYEKFALIIKLFSLGLLTIFFINTLVGRTSLLLLACLWLLEAVWKTYQHRIGERLLIIEQALNAKEGQPGMQFNSQWLANRPGLIGLLTEYGRSALKPTVAFPYAIMVALNLYWLLN